MPSKGDHTMNRSSVAMLIVSLALLPWLAGCATEPYVRGGSFDQETAGAITLFNRTDLTMQKLFDSAAGYAVFPTVTKGAIGIGAAHGEGQVFANGKLIGLSSLSQGTVGLQLGAQEYAEVIFFQDKVALDRFAEGQWALSAQATAVAAAEGAAADVNYQKGVMVFTVAKGGLMFEASVGGQRFTFTPLRKVPLY
jgi:lipid-binding SYLF domain-containing protein